MIVVPRIARLDQVERRAEDVLPAEPLTLSKSSDAA